MHTLFARIAPIILATVLLTTFGQCSVSRTWERKIPDGYTGKVVLRIGYGKTPDKVDVRWGGGTDAAEGEHVQPAGVQCIRVIGNRFYLIDDVAQSIKCFRSPGDLLWTSQRLPQLNSYAVTPSGQVYAVWGDLARNLSLLGRDGVLAWTRSLPDLLPQSALSALGLRESELMSFDGPEWTQLGLALVVVGPPAVEGGCNSPVALLSEKGDFIKALPSTLVGKDGSFLVVRQASGASPTGVSVDARDEQGRQSRKTYLNFGANPQDHLLGKARSGGVVIDPTGGLAMHGHASLPEPVVVHSGVTAHAERVLWRFSRYGTLTEEWRFLGDPFSTRCHPIVFGPDGTLYHVEHGAEKVELVAYSKDSR